MSVGQDIKKLKDQEALLRFAKFDEEEAWALGSLMRQRASEQELPLVIAIELAGRRLFYTALENTSPDNEQWARRKSNTVKRYHKSSYRVGRELLAKGAVLNEELGISSLGYAAHGGAFPIHVIGAGVIGVVAVSGIPQRQDHEFVVSCLAEFLKISYRSLALEDELPSEG